MPLLSVNDLRFHFHTRDGVVRAVDGISYDLEAGATLGIVGESGSGKSVSAYALLGLNPMPPGRVEGGSALFEGRDLLSMPAKDLRRVRGKDIALIFQDPMTALNPFMTVGAQLAEPLRLHEGLGKREALGRALAGLKDVGIQDAERRLNAYPHQFSGGMRQRVMIAMALITRPKLLIADEPTTALDVTVQAQILELIKKLQEDLGTAVILITHDLGVVAGNCEQVIVMYAGRVCESAPVDALFADPKHPYTEALIGSLPGARQHGETLYAIPGLPPDLTQPIQGCPFAPRCKHAEAICRESEIDLNTVQDHHASSCIRVQAGAL